MFFRRGRINPKKAHALLVELFDHRYQWPLRLPIIHLLARGEPLRFLCALRFLVDALGQGIYLLNQKSVPEQTPWFGDNLDATASELPLQPVNLANRLTSVLRLDDPFSAEAQLRRLLLEIIDLTPKEKLRRAQASEGPVVSWLPQVAAGEQREDSTQADQAILRQIARQAVRIVWRLPGSRLATLTGSVAAGHADLTSDIDISLFGLKLPDVDVRRSLIAATSDAPHDITQMTHKTYASDTFWLKDRSPAGYLHLIDVHYFLIEEAQRLIQHPEPTTRAQEELLAHLSTAEILVDYEFRGPELLRNLQQATHKARTERLSRSLADLETALTDLETSRDAPRIFYATTDAVLALFQVLAAGNDRWIRYPKWTETWLDSLEHAPDDLHQRLSAVALLPFRPEHIAPRIRTLRSLEGETRAIFSAATPS